MTIACCHSVIFSRRYKSCSQCFNLWLIYFISRLGMPLRFLFSQPDFQQISGVFDPFRTTDHLNFASSNFFMSFHFTFVRLSFTLTRRSVAAQISARQEFLPGILKFLVSFRCAQINFSIAKFRTKCHFKLLVLSGN